MRSRIDRKRVSETIVRIHSNGPPWKNAVAKVVQRTASVFPKGRNSFVFDESVPLFVGIVFSHIDVHTFEAIVIEVVGCGLNRLQS